MSKPEGVKKVNTTSENVAIKGFDTAAYFAENGAVKGYPKFEFDLEKIVEIGKRNDFELAT